MFRRILYFVLGVIALSVIAAVSVYLASKPSASSLASTITAKMHATILLAHVQPS